MARGTTLMNLLVSLKAEIGQAAAANTLEDARLQVLLANKQKQLSSEYDWPFLEDEWDVNVGAGVQYLAYPTQNINGVTSAINLERMPIVETLWTTVYQPVEYGIGRDQYNMLNFQLLQQSSDPIQRWRMYTNVNETANANKFEVWPVPASQQTMRFTGQRTLLPLVGGSDTADLDELLLVLGVAWEYLKRNKQADWQEKQNLFFRRFSWCKQQYPTDNTKYCLGNQNDFKKDRKLVGMLIAVR